MSENACQTAQERVCSPIVAAHEQDTASDETGPQNGPEWTMEPLAGLRVYVGRHARMDEMTKAALLVYAREIEREVKELVDERDLLKTQWEAGVDFDQRLEAAASERADVTLFGVDYTALPVDADGIPIHVGDVMEWCNGTFTVHELKVTEDGWTTWDEQHGYTVYVDVCHHHAPTVEDVLREFTERLDEIGSEDDCAGVDEQECRACIRRDIAAAYAEYAARLMLAGEDE